MSAAKALIRDLERIVGRQHVISREHDLVIFERDGSVAGALPDVVVLPIDTAQVAAVVKAAAEHGVPIVPRGAGTGLSGGAVTVRGGVALQLTRMRRILNVDTKARTALVEPGVVNYE